MTYPVDHLHGHLAMGGIREGTEGSERFEGTTDHHYRQRRCACCRSRHNRPCALGGGVLLIAFRQNCISALRLRPLKLQIEVTFKFVDTGNG